MWCNEYVHSGGAILLSADERNGGMRLRVSSLSTVCIVACLFSRCLRFLYIILPFKVLDAEHYEYQDEIPCVADDFSQFVHFCVDL